MLRRILTACPNRRMIALRLNRCYIGSSLAYQLDPDQFDLSFSHSPYSHRTSAAHSIATIHQSTRSLSTSSATMSSSSTQQQQPSRTTGSLSVPSSASRASITVASTSLSSTSSNDSNHHRHPLPIQIRPSTEADVPAIHAIYSYWVKNGTGTFEEIAPTVDEMRARRQDVISKALPFLVATAPVDPFDPTKIERKVVGYASVNYFRPRTAYRFTLENSLYIHPDYCGGARRNSDNSNTSEAQTNAAGSPLPPTHAPTQKQPGVGSLLLSELLSICTCLGYREMLAVIGDSNNAGSIGLSTKYGFDLIGVTKNVGYKFNRWLDVVFMQKHLQPIVADGSDLPPPPTKPFQPETYTFPFRSQPPSNSKVTHAAVNDSPGNTPPAPRLVGIELNPGPPKRPLQDLEALESIKKAKSVESDERAAVREDKDEEDESNLARTNPLPSSSNRIQLAHRHWQELSVDFMESIAAFLSLREFSYVNRTCHAWQQVCTEITSLGSATIDIRSISSYESLCASTSSLRGHITRLNLGSRHRPHVALCSLPRLTSLTYQCTCEKGMEVVMLPKTLKELDVELILPLLDDITTVTEEMVTQHFAAGMNEVTSVIGLETLSLHFRNLLQENHSLTFSDNVFVPFQRISTSLAYFAFDCGWSIRCTYSPEGMNIFRSLTQLTYLYLNGGNLTTQQFSWLLSEPIPFTSLREISLLMLSTWEMDQPTPTLDLIGRLVTLERFELEDMQDVKDVSFLIGMTQLTSLKLTWDYPGRHIDNMVSSLSHCHRLRNLTLGYCRIPNADHNFPILISHLPHLTSLTLGGLNITRLTFIPTYLSHTLLSLNLNECREIEARELFHLCHTSICSLSLTNSFIRGLDSFTRDLFSPGSPRFMSEWFPSLTTFHHEYESADVDYT